MRKLLIFLAFFAIGCTPSVGPDGTSVGAACTDDRDCETTCTTEREFGGAMCTKACASDQDCPEGAICVEKQGGLCAVSCAAAADCAGFGRGFTCKGMRRKSGGDTLVCRIQ